MMPSSLPPRLKMMLGATVLLSVAAAVLSPDDELIAERENPASPRPADPHPRGKAAVSARNAYPTEEQAAEMAAFVNSWRSRSKGGPLAAPSTGAGWASLQPPAPPAPPPPPQVEAEPPKAPPFPYGWVGRFIDDTPRAVIAGQSATWVFKQGDVMEGQWRFDRIQERQLTVTYLPLGQSQTLAWNQE